MEPIAVTTEISDLPFCEPLPAFEALRQRFGVEQVFLLESLSGPKDDARASLVGFHPLLRLSVKDLAVELDGIPALVEAARAHGRAAGALRTSADELHSRRDLWELLRAVQSLFTLDPELPGDTFGFGFFGYLSYDVAWGIEKLPRRIDTALDVPDVALVICQGLITFDLGARRSSLTLNQAASWEELRADEIAATLVAAVPETPAPVAVPPPGSVGGTVRREDYLSNARRALYYISIGDIYQVQLGHQIDIQTEAEPLDVYRRLRQRNPSPYMYVAPLGRVTLVGASPELYIRVEHGEITMRPIAGTARRSGNPAEDERAIARLRANEKEIAEHVMLVDLCRNDIGRVCQAGTLATHELLEVEQYSHVFHLVSRITGRQQPEADIYDVIAATFPAGTMTGAPKIRAMEIIEELESTRRGPYAGAVGLIGFGGYTNLALCIRSAIHRASGHYHIRASAGVVADSTPEGEWAETLHKMGALYWAITDEEIPHESFGC
ncbi:MAG TPA: anthranilate synthase component I family protein [Roseiflexaceae bacterium]|nr:anthranilate synthase component I family protein [Roseiflexaceae bacterium]